MTTLAAPPLSLPALRRRFLLFSSLRWLPTGLLLPVSVLFALDRGLSVAEVGIAFSIQGFTVLLCELPLGGLADSLGRRPALLVSSVVSLAALGLLAFSSTLWMFVLAYALQGVFRALDSGALEAWFADSALEIDPEVRLERDLSRASAALSLAIAAGALASSGLVLIAPLLALPPLLLPVLAAWGLTLVALLCVALGLPEPRRGRPVEGRGLVRDIPRVVFSGLALLRSSKTLLALVSVELLWGFGMVAYETLMPVRLEEVTHDAERAAAVMGPTTAAAWALAAVGAALAAPLAARIGVAACAAVLRIVQSAFVVAMGVVVGPVGLITAFLACYMAHGASNPVHNTLLHREADSSNRTVVLSMNSMVAQPSAALGALVLGAVAGGTSTGLAIAIGGVVLALAAPLYLPAGRREQRRQREQREQREGATNPPIASA